MRVNHQNQKVLKAKQEVSKAQNEQHHKKKTHPKNKRNVEPKDKKQNTAEKPAFKKSAN